MKQIAKTLTVAAVTAFVLSIAPAAKADDEGCSNITVQGTYALNYTGYTGFGTAPPTAPLSSVVALTFDEHGAVTGTGSASINGNINKVTQTGTYTINPDCTGTYEVLGASGFTSHFFFVIDDDGNEIRAICTDPTAVFSGGGRKLFPGKEF